MDMNGACIVENVPVTMADAALKKAIEESWGELKDFVRMRFLDASTKAVGGSGKASNESRGKVLFQLVDDSKLKLDLVPRCRRGHLLRDLHQGEYTECKATTGCSQILVGVGAGNGQICTTGGCGYTACSGCLESTARVSLRVHFGPSESEFITLKIKRAKGAITHPQPKTQLFVHVFPIASSDEEQLDDEDEGEAPPATRLSFAFMLAKMMGFKVSQDEEAWLETAGALTDEDAAKRAEMNMLLELDGKVERKHKGPYFNNLLAFLLSYLLTRPDIVESAGGFEEMCSLVDNLLYYVLDHSYPPMRPAPFCFFVELKDLESSEKLKTLLHDRYVTLRYPHEEPVTVLLDVMDRGTGMVQRGSLLQQNHLVTPDKYEQAMQCAREQVKSFMKTLHKGDYPDERREQQRAEQKRKQELGGGLNVAAKEFRPATTPPTEPIAAALDALSSLVPGAPELEGLSLTDMTAGDLPDLVPEETHTPDAAMTLPEAAFLADEAEFGHMSNAEMRDELCKIEEENEALHHDLAVQAYQNSQVTHFVKCTCDNMGWLFSEDMRAFRVDSTKLVHMTRELVHHREMELVSCKAQVHTLDALVSQVERMVDEAKADP